MNVVRTVPWVLLLVAIIVSSNATVVHAQTTSISGLTYPNTLSLSTGHALVSFTVSYSIPSYGSYYLVPFVWDESTNIYAHGSVVDASPDTCAADTGSYSWAAGCSLFVSGSGSEYVEFQVNLDVAGSANLAAGAGFVDSSGNVISDSITKNPFSIDVQNTVTLSLSAPNGIAVTVDGVQEGSTVSMDVNPGSHLIVVPDIVNTRTGTRLRFDHWSDGSTDATRTMDLETDESLTAIYVTQYYVTATQDAVNFQSGWYDDGATTQFSLNPSSTNQLLIILGAFDGWYNNDSLITKSTTGSITINGPVNLTAKWGYGYIPYIALIIVAAIVTVVFLLRTRTKERRSKQRKRRTRRTIEPATEPVTVPVTSETTEIASDAVVAEKTKARAKTKATTMFCHECGAKLPRDSIFCEECGSKLVRE